MLVGRLQELRSGLYMFVLVHIPREERTLIAEGNLKDTNSAASFAHELKPYSERCVVLHRTNVNPWLRVAGHQLELYSSCFDEGLYRRPRRRAHR